MNIITIEMICTHLPIYQMSKISIFGTPSKHSEFIKEVLREILLYMAYE